MVKKLLIQEALSVFLPAMLNGQVIIWRKPIFTWDGMGLYERFVSPFDDIF